VKIRRTIELYCILAEVKALPPGKRALCTGDWSRALSNTCNFYHNFINEEGIQKGSSNTESFEQNLIHFRK